MIYPFCVQKSLTSFHAYVKIKIVFQSLILYFVRTYFYSSPFVISRHNPKPELWSTHFQRTLSVAVETSIKERNVPHLPQRKHFSWNWLQSNMFISHKEQLFLHHIHVSVTSTENVMKRYDFIKVVLKAIIFFFYLFVVLNYLDYPVLFSSVLFLP